MDWILFSLTSIMMIFAGLFWLASYGAQTESDTQKEAKWMDRSIQCSLLTILLGLCAIWARMG